MSSGQVIPDIITDNNNVRLIKEQYLGKGGFGRCYALKCSKTGDLFAGKFLDKKEIERYNVGDKITQEINIHKTLNHKNIVGFKSCIEDKQFIYIILELCSNRSMSELIKRRKYITIFEAKYYMKQVVSAVVYLHEKKIIHRDLKLGNLFINQNMIIKVGDFGLAIKVKNDKSNRRSLCGTPNYIAPEVLSRQGHSYEVDIWALGCILYTLLVGIPPFETESVEETYSLIKKCEYTIPETVKNSAAINFITNTLQKDPKNRPPISELSNHDFLNVGFIPKKLPQSCIVMPPRTKTLLQYSDRKRKHPIRSPLHDINALSDQNKTKFNDNQLQEMLRKLCGNIRNILSKAKTITNITDDSQNPSLRPFIWINSWMDYSHKYGFTYRLNDNTVGALFNDDTTLLMLPSGKNLQYFENNGTEFYFNIGETQEPNIMKKIKILKSLRKIMFNSLKNAYEDSDEPLSSLPILKCWVNTENVIGMFLSNGTLQINFCCDHMKLVLCPIMEAVTVISNWNQILTYQLDLLPKYGCSKLLLDKLKQVIKIIKIITTRETDQVTDIINNNFNNVTLSH